MKGHIKLGAPGDLRDYLLIDPRNYRATTANPMAARVSTGSQYGDLQAWSTFLMADWQAGVGKQQAEAGGFLFGEIESRVPNQLILPAALGCSWIRHVHTGAIPITPEEICTYMPEQATSFSVQQIGGTGNPTRISIEIKIASGSSEEQTPNPDIREVWFYGFIPDGVEVTAALFSDNSGVPGSSVASGTVTPASNYRPGYHWYHVTMGTPYTTRHDGNANFHWVIYPTISTNTIQIVQGNNYAGAGSHLYASSAWAVNTEDPFFMWGKPMSRFVDPGAG
jgi:hypothetical protein